MLVCVARAPRPRLLTLALRILIEDQISTKTRPTPLSRAGRTRARAAVTTHSASLFHSGQVAVPAVCCHQPDPEPSPDLHKFPPVSDRGAVRLLDRLRCSAQSRRRCRQTARLESSPDEDSDSPASPSLRSINSIGFGPCTASRCGGIRKPSASKQSGSVIVISSIESSDEILREFAHSRLHVQPGIDASGTYQMRSGTSCYLRERD